MKTSSLQVIPSGGPCGAEIRGVDFAHEVSPETIAEIRKIWLEHLVVAFPNQQLTLGRYEQVALLFGDYGQDPYFRGLPDHPHIAEVKREADEQTPLFAEGWHSDWSFLETPPTGTLLYGRIIPPVGGDTRYSNQYAAYDALDPAMKDKLEGLMGVHSARRGYSKAGQYGEKDVGRSMAIIYSDDALATQLHPLVQVHPETGRKALFLSPGYTIGIDGMDETEAQSLLMELYVHQAKEEFVYVHKWAPDMLTIWDNRAVIHAATGGYQGHRRLLQRITVTGMRA